MLFPKNLFDERFILHRLKATRFATVITVLAMAVYINIEIIIHHVIRYDLIVFLGILLVSKVAAAVYYRITD